MTSIVSAIATLMSIGFTSDLPVKWLRTWDMLCIAFPRCCSSIMAATVEPAGSNHGLSTKTTELCRDASSGTRDRALDVRRQRARLDRRRGHLVQAARPLRGGRAQRHRHRRHLFDVGAGPQGRRVRDGDRQLAQGARRPRQGRHRHQGGLGPEGGRPGARPHPRQGRGVAQAAADRLHRPLPVAPRRSRDAAGGDAGGARDADQAGQGARHRLPPTTRRRAWRRRCA